MTPSSEHVSHSVRQHTLARAVSWRGEVHHGEPVALVLHPAPVDSGVRVRRRGVIPEHAEIRAHWESVIDADPAVVLANANGVTVRGAATLLAALRALGLDNALIEVDGREIPGGVGSFCSFLETIVDAGVQAQDAPRHALRIDQVVEVRDSVGFAALSPAPDFCVRLGVTSSNRTGEKLLVSGALVSNLLEPAHGDEPWDDDRNDRLTPPSGALRPLWDVRALPPLLRARMLNTVGHLALAGAPLIGHMRGYRSSPGLHHALLRALLLRRAATPVNVDEHRKSLLTNPAVADRHALLATVEPNGYYH